MNNTLCVTNFFNFFIKFLNKMDGQTLDKKNPQLHLKWDGGSTKTENITILHHLKL